MGDNRGKRLAILFWDGHLGVAPSLIAGISTLASQGYDVDVVLRGSVGACPPPPEFDANRVRLITMTPTYSAGAGILWAESGLGARIRLLANRIRRTMCGHLDRVRYSVLCRRLARRERYDAIIGVDV